jgi:twinkle protein
LARYDDNSAHCFACKDYNEKGDGEPVQALTDDTDKSWTPLEGDVIGFEREFGINEKTCAFWRYKVGRLSDGTPCHIMESRDDSGKLIGQKLRTPETKGLWKGNAKNPPLYGKWLWPAGGKYLTITEGEKDAMSMSQANGLKFPVVSLPNGTGSVAQVIKRDYDYITSFETIVLMFDMDEPGQKAVEDALELLPPGKVKVAKLARKDANDVLFHDGPGPLVEAFWKAEVYRPDGIVDGSEFTLERISAPTSAGFPFRRHPKLQEMTYGLRKGELTIITAGSGIGKSTWARELAYDLHQQDGQKIGNVYLEENNTKTAQGYVALHAGVPLGRYRHNPLIVPEAVRREALEKIIQQRMLFYDHFGSLESKRLMNKLRYMAQVEKCDFGILDHISIMTSGIESSSEGERKDIDILMTNLRSLIEETGIGIIAIVHLKRSQGKNFNEGAQVSLTDFRGSAAIEQLCDNAYALERNQQGDESLKRLSQIRVLKCREGEDTGEADLLAYNKDTGRNELASAFQAEAVRDARDATAPKGRTRAPQKVHRFDATGDDTDIPF